MAKSVTVTPTTDRPNYYYVGADRVFADPDTGELYVYANDHLQAVWARNQWCNAEINNKEGS